jgi:hypothetical protein
MVNSVNSIQIRKYCGNLCKTPGCAWEPVCLAGSSVRGL